jgi:hypothetical protein
LKGEEILFFSKNFPLAIQFLYFSDFHIAKKSLLYAIEMSYSNLRIDILKIDYIFYCFNCFFTQKNISTVG